MSRSVEKASKSKKASTHTPALLSGGKPQIAKADGDAPVQAYIAEARAGAFKVFAFDELAKQMDALSRRGWGGCRAIADEGKAQNGTNRIALSTDRQENR